MDKRYVVLLWVCLTVCCELSAQEKDWTAKDSLWLQRVLSGEEKLRLNDETMKAIESGTLLAPELSPKEQMQSSPYDLPIVRSFDGIIQPHKNLHTEKIPPAVYRLYQLGIPDSMLDAPFRSCLFYRDNIDDFKKAEAVYIHKATVDDKQTIPGITFNFDANDILSTLLSPLYRTHKHNVRNANAYKSFEFDEHPSSRIESERRRLNEYINKLKQQQQTP